MYTYAWLKTVSVTLMGEWRSYDTVIMTLRAMRLRCVIRYARATRRATVPFFIRPIYDLYVQLDDVADTLCDVRTRRLSS